MEEFSGFCLYDNKFPIIYINNSKPYSRQIFTLFHELCHLLYGIGGIDTRIDNYIKYLDGDDKLIEINCNKFAALFLVPEDDFKKQYSVHKIDEYIVENLADRYHVSREVVLRKFLDRGMVGVNTYEQMAKQWKASRKGGTGGDYYLTKGSYIGKGYLELAFGNYYQRKISFEQLAEYLGVKPKFVSGMEALLYK
jgi:Zn-dependent peptidase ImmA (M78 family)